MNFQTRNMLGILLLYVKRFYSLTQLLRIKKNQAPFKHSLGNKSVSSLSHCSSTRPNRSHRKPPLYLHTPHPIARAYIRANLFILYCTHASRALVDYKSRARRRRIRGTPSAATYIRHTRRRRYTHAREISLGALRGIEGAIPRRDKFYRRVRICVAVKPQRRISRRKAQDHSGRCKSPKRERERNRAIASRLPTRGYM